MVSTPWRTGPDLPVTVEDQINAGCAAARLQGQVLDGLVIASVLSEVVAYYGYLCRGEGLVNDRRNDLSARGGVAFLSNVSAYGSGGRWYGSTCPYAAGTAVPESPGAYPTGRLLDWVQTLAQSAAKRPLYDSAGLAGRFRVMDLNDLLQRLWRSGVYVHLYDRFPNNGSRTHGLRDIGSNTGLGAHGTRAEHAETWTVLLEQLHREYPKECKQPK